MRYFLVALIMACVVPAAWAAEFDPDLAAKAAAYQDWLQEWHSTGLGGVSDVLFTDATRTEIYRTWGAGDSGDWTGTYLATQAMRYVITGEQNALDEVERIANYMHILHDITGDPGYLARYAAPDQPPWNVENAGGDNVYPGTGEYEGDFWLGHNVRDKYITWFWGMSWAYEVLEGQNEDLRSIIREDMREIILTLESNDWTIIDPWGQIYSAAAISPDIRLSILLQAAFVIDEPYFDELLDTEYEKNKELLWLTTIAFFNRYYDYYAFINNYSNSSPLFRLWPDRARMEHLFQVWMFNVRQWSDDGHNPFFDAVYYQACLRLGSCDQAGLEAIQADAYQSLVEMYDAPNWQRQKTCTTLELDPFSVWAHDLLEQFPWIEELFGFTIEYQTLDAHEVWDRCWDSVLWERSPYDVQCAEIGDDPAHVTHGVDYLIGYWLGVYYGILPGDGPYGDDDPTDDDTTPADDDTTPADDDTTPADDDSTPDDDDSTPADDDTTPTDDDATPDDDDTLADDDVTPGDDDTLDDDTSPAAGDDDDSRDNADGCGC